MAALVFSPCVTPSISAASILNQEPVAQSHQTNVKIISTVVGAGLGGIAGYAYGDQKALPIVLGAALGGGAGFLIGYAASGYTPTQLFNAAINQVSIVEQEAAVDFRNVVDVVNSRWGGSYPLVLARDYYADMADRAFKIDRLFSLIASHPEGRALATECQQIQQRARAAGKTLTGFVTAITSNPDYAAQRKLHEQARIAAEAAALERQKIAEKARQAELDRLQREREHKENRQDRREERQDNRQDRYEDRERRNRAAGFGTSV